MKRKILHLYPDLEIGGASNILLTVCQILNDDFKNYIISKNNINYNMTLSKNIFFEFDIKNKSSLFIRLFHYVKYFFFLYKIIKEKKIQIIVNHHRYLSPAIFLISKIFKIKIIFYAHSNPSKIIFFDKKIFGNYILSVSRGVKNTLIKNYNIDNKKIFIIYNGIKPLILLSKNKILKYKNQLNLNKRVFCCIAHFRPIKRQLFLLKAYKKILKYNLDSTLILYGYGQQKNQIINFINKNKISKNVIVLSNDIYSVEEILNLSDFSILPSEREGLGISIIESFSLKKPVIGTNISGINEIIINNRNGFLFRKNSINDLSKYIDLLLNNNELCKNLGKNSYETYNKKFNYYIFKKNIKNYFKYKLI